MLDAVLDAHPDHDPDPPAPSAAPRAAPQRAREARSAEQPGDELRLLALVRQRALLAERLELRHLHGRELRLAQLLRLVRVRVRVRVRG